jgi:pimeloyl-ACP methyl ester carboxylesterase
MKDMDSTSVGRNSDRISANEGSDGAIGVAAQRRLSIPQSCHAELAGGREGLIPRYGRPGTQRRAPTRDGRPPSIRAAGESVADRIKRGVLREIGDRHREPALARLEAHRKKGAALALGLDRLGDRGDVDLRPQPGIEASRSALQSLDVAADRAVAVALSAQAVEVEAALGDRGRRSAADADSPKLPVYVLSKGQSFGAPDEQPGFPTAALDRAWRKAQNWLARLLPHTPHVIATDGDHNFFVSDPQLVIKAIRDVVRRVCAPRTGAERRRVPARQAANVSECTLQGGDLN